MIAIVAFLSFVVGVMLRPEQPEFDDEAPTTEWQ